MNAMYNRYIPQPDGSYRRDRKPDPGNQAPAQTAKPPAPEQEIPPYSPMPDYHPAPHRQNSGGFLSNLLPPNFDLGDLIVMLLLFLMAGDSQEDRNTAILTMALYFIL